MVRDDEPDVSSGRRGSVSGVCCDCEFILPTSTPQVLYPDVTAPLGRFRQEPSGMQQDNR
ncbi:uncharacterized protein M421DRAFT_424966 [Didymella exigua CBS 183.55]|uniref:Uncharacterized protein n=1 Tax=Didymella exigua CBS 183.55 TaxID=1150837 RepID=A0A6A5RAJ2_9PLEO|nr:uncharacterized protein M421DRAFT_424966 [Didymella exigua CBS 183.55]KAF1924329.1 hypothetical protein M421DRAFT_424966 [Didymella exigua CBS 183.55]